MLKKRGPYGDYAPQTPLNSLEGLYDCQWCGEPHAQWRRFGIPVPSNDRTHIVYKGSFCTPECCAAGNKYRSLNAGTDECAARHILIEQCYERRVKAAPPKTVLLRMTREQWLPQTRNRLTKDELHIIMSREMPLIEGEYGGVSNAAAKVRK